MNLDTGYSINYFVDWAVLYSSHAQEASFKKAVSDEEMPMKMKHVRSLIIGTYTDKNADIFWRNVATCPPNNTDVTAWKFCHCLHVMFRDGHPNVLRDSHRHVNRIKDTGQHFVSDNIILLNMIGIL